MYENFKLMEYACTRDLATRYSIENKNIYIFINLMNSTVLKYNY